MAKAGNHFCDRLEQFTLVDFESELGHNLERAKEGKHFHTAPRREEYKSEASAGDLFLLIKDI